MTCPIRSLLLLLCLLAGSPAAAQNDYGSLLPRLKAAVAAFEGGKPRQAVALLEQILKTRPSAETVTELRDYLMNGNKLVKMLSAGGGLSPLVRYMLGRSEARSFTPITGEEQIQALIDRFIDGEPAEKYRAMLQIQARIGARAAPYFLRYLGEQESIENRTSAIIGLQKLGRTVVLPLASALFTPDATARQNCALVLGRIGDPRAAGALFALAGSTRQPDTVRQAARDALARLPGPLPNTTAACYLELARRYHTEEATPLTDLGVDTLFWQWEGGKLVGRKVPPFLINELLAEEACYGALRAEPENAAAWRMLLLTYLAQYAELRDLATAAAEKKAQLSAAEEALLGRLARVVWRINALAAAGGPGALDGALRQALAQGHGRLAEQAAAFLGRVAPHGSAPPAGLLQGLASGDRRVQLAAAQALARISPGQPFAEAGRVVALLGRGLAESDSRLVLVISSDAKLRGGLARAIEAAGHLPVQAAGGRAGIELARRFPLWDVVVLDLALEDLAPFEVYETLKRDVRTRNLPLLAVLGPADPAERKAVYDGNAVAGESGAGAAVTRLAGSVAGEYAARALRRAVGAAEALAALHPRDPVFDVSAATTQLAAALVRPDVVRLPAARALERHGTPAALPPLARLFGDGAASVTARLAAARAIGAICSRHPGSGASVAPALQQGLAGGDPRIQQAAGAALGRTGLSAGAYARAVEAARLRAERKGRLK